MDFQNALTIVHPERVEANFQYPIPSEVDQDVLAEALFGLNFKDTEAVFKLFNWSIRNVDSYDLQTDVDRFETVESDETAYVTSDGSEFSHDSDAWQHVIEQIVESDEAEVLLQKIANALPRVGQKIILKMRKQ